MVEKFGVFVGVLLVVVGEECGMQGVLGLLLLLVGCMLVFMGLGCIVFEGGGGVDVVDVLVSCSGIRFFLMFVVIGFIGRICLFLIILIKVLLKLSVLIFGNFVLVVLLLGKVLVSILMLLLVSNMFSGLVLLRFVQLMFLVL